MANVPSEGDKSVLDKNNHYGYAQLQNQREYQEDRAASQVLPEMELTPKEIGQRLWTTYKTLDENVPQNGSGTTASTTIYDGKGNLITATVGDASSFAVLYDHEGNALGVVRLNSNTHNVSDKDEQSRIESEGGALGRNNMFGELRPNSPNGKSDGPLVSRRIGDHRYKGISSDSDIDITNISKIAQDLKIDPQKIGKIQIMAVSDGFTDGPGKWRNQKQDHEEYLLSILKNIPNPGMLNEEQLAIELSESARFNASNEDNITVAIQTITNKTTPCLLGVYDGHGGKQTAEYVAKNIGKTFEQQCKCSKEEYERQDLAAGKSAAYKRDNGEKKPDIEPSSALFKLSVPEVKKSSAQTKELEKSVKKLIKLTENCRDQLYNIPPNERTMNHKEVQRMMERLLILLNSKEINAETKITQFYTFLNTERYFPTYGDTKQKNQPFTNLEWFKNQTDHDEKIKPGKSWLKGIGLVALTLMGLFPGLITMGIAYKVYGIKPAELISKTDHVKQFKKDLGKIREEIPGDKKDSDFTIS
ncbi:hypothetical protein [Legionella brunensis]|uniref:Protein phosphatase 2C n=1 Tax=Legionella brunensis TaxID=29422 RepID=A0A0W0SEQ9_9GAMM|nr:hypothetical protein [Legionella brunensis]KTC81588.1 Protein phosphatase 2C [Legionella brunensis]